MSNLVYSVVLFYIRERCANESLCLFITTSLQRCVASDLSQCLPSMCNMCNAIPKYKLLVR